MVVEDTPKAIESILDKENLARFWEGDSISSIFMSTEITFSLVPVFSYFFQNAIQYLDPSVACYRAPSNLK